MTENFFWAAVAAAGLTELVKVGREPAKTSNFVLRFTAIVSGALAGLALDRTLPGLVIGIGAGGLSTTVFWAAKSWIKNRSSQV